MRSITLPRTIWNYGQRPGYCSKSSMQLASKLISGSRWNSTAINSSISNAKPAPAMPNELLRIIVNHIKTHGPMPLPRYINLCLSHPTLGYYTRMAERAATEEEGGTAVIGRKGDFITSPEISQVFGELLAVWYITQWQAQGMPSKTRIVELGPGRGTLMDDMLRTFKSIPMFGNTIREIHLVETSEYFKKLQKDKLSEWEQKGIKIQHHQDIQAVGTADSDTFTIIIAHEFFDALPIHMFEKRAEGWREVFVDLEKRPQTPNDERKKVLIPGQPALPQVIGGRRKAEDEAEPKLRFVASPSPTLAANLLVRNSDERFKGLSQGTRIEVCPDMYGIAATAAKLVQPKGAGLVVDYGGDRFFNHSFRAFKNHKLADPLEEPGSADLTSNVDFSALRDALMSGFTSTEAAFAEAKASSLEDSPKKEQKDTLCVPPLLSQRSFLLSLGLQLRVEKLVQNAPNDERRKDIITAAQRLVDKNEKIHGMGKVFKVLGFVPAQEGSEKQEVFPFGKELD